MRQWKVVRIVLLIPVWWACGGVGEAGVAPVVSFSAEVTRIQGNPKTTSTGKMYVSPEGIRTESVRDGVSIALLHKPEQKKVLTLFPAQKNYMENEVGVTLSRPPLPDEPDSPCRTNKAFKCRQVGQEKVNGRAVIHWEIVIQGQDREVPHAHLWIDPRLLIAIRELYPDGLSVELSNIQEGTQASQLFSVPGDYEKIVTAPVPAKTSR
ncbi:MAG: hypothetical protein HQM02_09875 [Magnetococcales bacterium]|nr:hypothetical protein [Magnetococcales bacterium]